MPNSTLGRSDDRNDQPGKRDEQSFLSPETIAPPVSDVTAASTSPTADRLGEYEMLREIARGGMGVVYQVRHRTLGRIVALKMILHGGADATAVRRFRQEAKAAAALDHPGIVPLFDFGVHNGQPYFTMPFLPGGSLAARVRETGPPPIEETLRLMRGIVAAVAHAHERGIIHRDLKPENVLIDPEGRPRITDFGLAKLRDDGTEMANLTAPGQVMGTPAYLAPEQVHAGQAPVGPRADVYSLGGILYFLLTGKPPFYGSSIADVLLSVVQRPPTPPSRLHESVPADLEAVCLRCLEKDPARRYQSALEMGHALGFGLSPESSGTRSLPPIVAEGLVRRPRPRIRALLSSMALLLCLGVTAALAYVVLGKAEVEPQQASAQQEELKPGERPSEPKTEKKASVRKVADRAALLWLEEMEKQGVNGRGVEVELIGSVPGQDGVHRLRAGQSVRLRVKSAEAGHLGVWTISPDGCITQLFPSAECKEDNRVQAGKPLLIPEDGDIVATPDGGRERLLVLRASQPWDVLRGEKHGPYFVFRDLGEAQKLRQSLRGLMRVPGFTSKVIPFEVGAEAEGVGAGS